MLQREQVAWLADAQPAAFVHVFVHGLRTAARRRVEQNAQQVAMAFFRVIAQRVLAHQAIGQVHVDMRAGAESRQDGMLGRGQFKAVDAFGFEAFAGHNDIDHHWLPTGCSAAINRRRTRRQRTAPASTGSSTGLRPSSSTSPI
ncbi:hypothetical protein D3C71_1386860 [compost metagenome]